MFQYGKFLERCTTNILFTKCHQIPSIVVSRRNSTPRLNLSLPLVLKSSQKIALITCKAPKKDPQNTNRLIYRWLNKVGVFSVNGREMVNDGKLTHFWGDSFFWEGNWVRQKLIKDRHHCLNFWVSNTQASNFPTEFGRWRISAPLPFRSRQRS